MENMHDRVADMKVLGIVRSAGGYGFLQKLLRSRWQQLSISGESLDEISGLTGRYVSKLLAPRPPKNLGPQSLGPVLGSLAVALVVVEDRSMLARIAKHVGKQTIETDARATMPTRKKQRKTNKRRSVWKNCPEWGKLMAARRQLLLDPRKRSKLARRAAKCRWAAVAAKRGHRGRKEPAVDAAL